MQYALCGNFSNLFTIFLTELKSQILQIPDSLKLAKNSVYLFPDSLKLVKNSVYLF